MRFTSVEQVKPGLWVTQCCERDLYQIVTDKQLVDIREYLSEWLQDEDGLAFEYWESERAALVELRSRYMPGVAYSNEAIADIDKRLAKITVS